VDPFLEKFIEDIVKGANDSFARGSRAHGERLNVEITRNNHGHEQKLANHAGLGALAGGMMLPGLGAPIGAAMGADEGRRGSAAIGSVLGGAGGAGLGALGGGGLGALLGLLANNPALGAQLGAGAGAGIGGVGGMMYGAQKGGHKDSLIDKLSEARDNGAGAAASRFGIKEAFLPLLGSIAGPALARAGVGALARGAGGSALGGMAGKVLPRIGGGMGGMAFDAATSMAGGALGNRLQPQGSMG
jgi:hypothetical protein